MTDPAPTPTVREALEPAKLKELITDLRCGASTSTDVGLHMRKYQALCDRAADALEILTAVPSPAPDQNETVETLRRENERLTRERDVARTTQGITSRFVVTAEARATALQAERDRMAEALRWYADPKNWKNTPSWDGDPDCVTPNAIPFYWEDGGQICDCGDRARAAFTGNTQETGR